MTSKSPHVPTAVVLIIAVFLLITFWRTNMGEQYSLSGPQGNGTSVTKPWTTPNPDVGAVTVTVTAPPAAVTHTVVEKIIQEQPPLGSNSAATTIKNSRPRYVFVDLGANGADSLETFLQTSEAKFKYDFPAPPWSTHKEAEIFLFEANPVFNVALVNARQKYGAVGMAITIYPSTVVDTSDGMRTFYLDKVNTEMSYWGSSTYKNHPDAIASGGQGTELSAINFARWLLMETLPQDYVVVKMDIEGAEYDILPHLVEMQAWTVIDVLLVEWHNQLPSEEAREAAKNAIATLEAKGVSCPHYDSST
ncbi:hypothetical protein V2A60_000785 [Cordyceps javanica]